MFEQSNAVSICKKNVSVMYVEHICTQSIPCLLPTNQRKAKESDLIAAQILVSRAFILMCIQCVWEY